MKQTDCLITTKNRPAIWQEARTLWLASRRSEHTRRAYERALRDLEGFCGKGPWETGRVDLIAWAENLKERGLAATTRQQYLAAASSFYRFAIEEYLVDGLPLTDFNPAASRAIRPKVNPYGKANWLEKEEARRILDAIDRNKPIGKRNYALILGYLMVGRRNSEWRLAKWGDFRVRGKNVFYRWSGKTRRDELQMVPEPVWEAILDYLQSCGKIGKIQQEDYIFTALSDRARRLPGVAAGNWDPSQAISLREAGRILKRYCRKAGIDPKMVCVHTLRHTAAMLRRETKERIEAISALLAHSNLSVTQIYLHLLEGTVDESWPEVAKLLEIRSDNTSYVT